MADCRLNNANATVQLKGDNDYTNVTRLIAERRIHQDGQKFIWYNMKVMWSDHYYCHVPGGKIPKKFLTEVKVQSFRGRPLILIFVGIM